MVALRAATHHPRRQAPPARRPRRTRRETHLARLRVELRELDRELPATLNADHPLHPGSAPAAPSPRPAAMPMATSIPCRTHLINDPMQSSASQLLDHQITPSAAGASLPSPSPPALRALPATHALLALPALLSLPTPAIPDPEPSSTPSSRRPRLLLRRGGSVSRPSSAQPTTRPHPSHPRQPSLTAISQPPPPPLTAHFSPLTPSPPHCLSLPNSVH